MTKESMIEFIEQRKEDLLKSSSQESQELLFYRDFFDGITTSSLQDILSLDEKEFVIASLSSRIHDKSFFDISSDVDSISSLFLHLLSLEHYCFLVFEMLFHLLFLLRKLKKQQ